MSENGVSPDGPSGPQIEEQETGWLVTIPLIDGQVRCQFAEVEQSKSHTLEAELTVWEELPGQAPNHFSARLNVLSLSAREQYRRQLDDAFGKGQWSIVLGRACQMLKEAWTSRALSVRFQDIPLETETRYRIANFLPEGAITTFFGMGDTGKGHLAIQVALAIALGRSFVGRAVARGRVMYVDFEDDEHEWARRIYRHCLGMGMEVPCDWLSYYSGRGVPLPDQLIALKREVEGSAADVLIVDSAVPACGDDPVKAEVVGRFFNALRRLGCTVMLIAHNNKAEDDHYPLGSIMWHNLTRASWFVKRSEEDDPNRFVMGLYHRKKNRMRPQAAFGLRFTFDEDETGPILVALQDIACDVDQLKHLSVGGKIKALLLAGGLSSKELGRALGMRAEAARLAAWRTAGVRSAGRAEDGSGLWELEEAVH